MITLFYKDITERLKSYRPVKDLMIDLSASRFPIDVSCPPGLFTALLLTYCSGRINKPILTVMPTEREAETLIRDLELFDIRSQLFPWWGSMPYSDASPKSRVFGDRIRCLTGILQNQYQIVVTSLRSVLNPLPPVQSIKKTMLELEKGGSIDPMRLGALLQEYGYLRVPKVSVHGEYALRGEVLDVFLSGAEYALRVVFAFDIIEEIKLFDPISQSSLESITSADIYPMKEVVWTEDRIETLRKNCSSAPEMKNNGDALLEEIRTKGYANGEEMYYSLAFDEQNTLADYFLKDVHIFLAEYERLQTAEDGLLKEYAGLFNKQRFKRDVPDPQRLLMPMSRLEEEHTAVLRQRLLSDDMEKPLVRIEYEPPRSFFGNVPFLKEELNNLEESGYTIYIFAESENQKMRIEHLLKDFNVTVFPESISGGFSLPALKIIVIQENEIFGRRKRIPKSVKSVQSKIIDTFVELSPGDYVVHVNYGIGRFKGIERITAAGNERDYIHLEYAGEEFIYIPLEQVNLIQRYIGSENDNLRLDKIGGKSWETRKGRVRRSVEDLAERLIKLYAKRKEAKGYAFSKDTEWQMEFEAAFPYEETTDQIRCIEDVKADMERPYPMDRLICGDVGYGKTEIGMRAAFKAVADGKQVAMLAPTTILAEQHYENFTERLEYFPVKTAMLSRFVQKKDQRRTVEQIKNGEIDLVVGTHRILQRDVKFKNLGLLIVDEEQRFGVKDKERLKEWRTNVDCLTLTATPIPRTLHMSLLKIRDMSVLTTPPRNRLPIETYIQEFSEELVADAIRKEVERGGQIYYLHNRVETLENVRLFLQKLVPELLIEMAHGQMSSEELEDIMHRFIHGGTHVLVATTIIENGIDIPNVNTIIIDRADMYGISQLYQLRGRVGRSGTLAYAYLFYPEQRALSELAMKRLQIISDYTELGSGFKIALKDLEVRGAGNLLGREQSGDILSVGFDMYVKLLDQAIREKTDEKKGVDEEVYLELEYSGFIPDTYIDEAVEKMEVYKKIASISTDIELEQIYVEIEDRFGPMPDEVLSLLALAEIRILCRKLSIATLRERKNMLEIEFSRLADVSIDKIMRLIEESGGNIKVDPKRPHVLVMNTGKIGLKEKSEFIRSKLSAIV